MKRTVSNFKVGEDRIRARVRIEDDECLPTSPLYRMGAYHLLQVLASQPDLTACLLSPFERLTIYHNGTAWVADAEAEVDAPPGGIHVTNPPNPA